MEKLTKSETGLNERSYAWQEPEAAMNGAALLQLRLAEGVPFVLYPFAQVGKRVKIRGGYFPGVEGLLTQWNQDRLVISIESIQRSLAIKIQGYEVGMA
jgi:hypothetical protein